MIPILYSSQPHQFSKFNDDLWVRWFLVINLSNFVSPTWKLDNPYCHNLCWLAQNGIWMNSFVILQCAKPFSNPLIYFIKVIILVQRSIFQTFWNPNSCINSLFFELETSNFGYLIIFPILLSCAKFQQLGQH